MNRSIAIALLLVGCAVSCGCSREEKTKKLGSDQEPNPGYVSRVSDEFKVGPEEKAALLKLARSSVEAYVRTGKVPATPDELAKRWPLLAEPRACFVTLRKHGELRGCIGSLEPRRPLLEDVRMNAVSAAVNDPRFVPVSAEELTDIDFEISVLDRPRPLEGVPVAQLPDWLGKHKPGLIIEYKGRRSTFLPSVWEDVPDPNEFLEHLCRKQGSPGDCWRDPTTRLSVYGSLKFAEKEKA